jgi:YVTN family beta-propeller protein
MAPLPATFGAGVAISPNGTRAYVANNGSGVCCGGGFAGPSSVSVIDTATNTVIATIPAGSPTAIAVTPDGAFIYLTDAIAKNVAVISTATNTVVATVPVGTVPQGIAIGTLQVDPPPPDPLDSLFTQVGVLITGGTVTAEQGAGLMDKLQQIRTKINDGQTAAACNQLDAFINQVKGLINNGSLTASQGQALITSANAVKAKLGC